MKLNVYKYLIDYESNDSHYKILKYILNTISEKVFNENFKMISEYSDENRMIFITEYHKQFRQVDIFNYATDMIIYTCIGESPIVQHILYNAHINKNMTNEEIFWEI